MTALVIRGDARRLPLPDASVQCVVTSPPYYLQRDYEHDGASIPDQIGQEPTPADYLTSLAAVLAECRRVLRPDGTLWWNMADTYSGKANSGQSVGRSGRGDHAGVIPGGVAPYKSLLLLPERFLIAAADAGWVVRNRVRWWKRNGMRHPVADRLVNLHEMLYLLTPQSRYWFDLDAIREPLAYPDAADGTRIWGGRNKSAGGRIGGSARLVGRPYGSADQAGGPAEYTERSPILGQRPADGTRHTGGHPAGRNPGDVWEFTDSPAADVKYTDERPGRRGHSGGPSTSERRTHPAGRNPGDMWEIDDGRPADVWDIPTTPNPQLHYAAFPHELARRCILAGSPPAGVVLDPFGGIGTTALVADVLGRTGISVDLSGDYATDARSRIADPAERARAMRVPKPEPVTSGQLGLFDGAAS